MEQDKPKGERPKGTAVATRPVQIGLDSTEATLKSAIDYGLKMYHAAYLYVARLAVVCVHHAAKHGQPAPLNMLYAGLHANDQAALRNFLRRTVLVCGFGLEDGHLPENVTPEETKEALKRGEWIKFSATTETFGVIRDSESEYSKANKKFVAEKLAPQMLEPSEENGWTAFNVKDNVKEFRALGDADAIKAIKSVLERFIKAEPTERRSISVSNKLGKILRNQLYEIEQFAPANLENDAAEASERRSDRRRPVKGDAETGASAQA